MVTGILTGSSCARQALYPLFSLSLCLSYVCLSAPSQNMTTNSLNFCFSLGVAAILWIYIPPRNIFKIWLLRASKIWQGFWYLPYMLLTLALYGHHIWSLRQRARGKLWVLPGEPPYTCKKSLFVINHKLVTMSVFWRGLSGVVSVPRDLWKSFNFPRSSLCL